MSSTSLRTVWLTLRATNYTTAALTGCLNQINGLIKGQTNLAMAQIQLGKSALMAGTMFQVLGQQMGGTAGQVLSLTGNFMQIAGIMSMVSGTLQVLQGVEWANTMTVFGMTISYQNLAIAIAAAFASFMIFYQLFKGLPTWSTAVIAAIMGIVAALWAWYVAESAVTWGIAGIMGGAAAAAALATANSMQASTGHQMGTRMIGVTGPAILHRGEVVYNPSTGRPTQVGNDLAGGFGGTRIIDASMHVDTLNTKMDTEELDRALKKQGRTLAQNNR